MKKALKKVGIVIGTCFGFILILVLEYFAVLTTILGCYWNSEED